MDENTFPHNQREFLAYFNDRHKIPMNPELFKRSDEEIIEELKKVILSCERHNKYFALKVLNFEVVEDYAQINQILYDHFERKGLNHSPSYREELLAAKASGYPSADVEAFLSCFNDALTLPDALR